MSNEERFIDREVARRTSRSVFDEDGNLRRDVVDQTNKGDVFLGEYLNIADIPWAPEPDGAEHCQNLARLVEYMGELPPKLGGLGPLEMHDRKVLHAVAMLYAVGKGTMGVSGGDALGEPGFAQRSAAYAERFFRDGGGGKTYWSKDVVREDVCRLIARHNDERAIRDDRRLQVFADGLRYENERLEKNTAQGLAILRERCRPEMFFSGWAATKDNFRAWMLSRGWR